MNQDFNNNTTKCYNGALKVCVFGQMFILRDVTLAIYVPPCLFLLPVDMMIPNVA